jgi:hypothetical protein
MGGDKDSGASVRDSAKGNSLLIKVKEMKAMNQIIGERKNKVDR